MGTSTATDGTVVPELLEEVVQDWVRAEFDRIVAATWPRERRPRTVVGAAVPALSGGPPPRLQEWCRRYLGHRGVRALEVARRERSPPAGPRPHHLCERR